MNSAFSTMAARSELSPARWRRPYLRWIDAVEAGWAVPLLLAAFIAVWMTYLVIAYVQVDLHPDALQAWSSGRRLQWGYLNQPPLAAWIARGWTSVFPLANWSFELLSLTLAAIGLCAVDRITRRFARRDRRLLVLLLLLLLPIYQLYGQQFGADAVLLAAWPVATWCYLRSFTTRGIGWAVAAGLTAALALLTSYQSALLLASFALAAICHPQRRAYFGSSAPWVSALAASALFGPHVYWLATTDAQPWADALARFADGATAMTRIEAVLYILVFGVVLAIAVAIWSLAAAEPFKKFAERMEAMKPGLLLLLLVAIGTIVVAALTAAALGIGPALVWQPEGVFLFAILMVCCTRFAMPRFHTVNLAALVTAVALVSVLVGAPLHALYRNFNPLPDGRNYYRSAAAELARHWHKLSDKPLVSVGGDPDLALAVAFYGPDHPGVEPRLLPNGAGVAAPEAVFQRGFAGLCLDGDAGCAAAMESLATGAPRFVKTDFVLESRLLGFAGHQQRLTAFIVPAPASEPPVATPPAAVSVAPPTTVTESSISTTPPPAAPATTMAAIAPDTAVSTGAPDTPAATGAAAPGASGAGPVAPTGPAVAPPASTAGRTAPPQAVTAEEMAKGAAARVQKGKPAETTVANPSEATGSTEVMPPSASPPKAAARQPGRTVEPGRATVTARISATERPPNAAQRAAARRTTEDCPVGGSDARGIGCRSAARLAIIGRPRAVARDCIAWGRRPDCLPAPHLVVSPIRREIAARPSSAFCGGGGWLDQRGRPGLVGWLCRWVPESDPVLQDGEDDEPGVAVGVLRDGILYQRPILYRPVDSDREPGPICSWNADFYGHTISDSARWTRAEGSVHRFLGW